VGEPARRIQGGNCERERQLLPQILKGEYHGRDHLDRSSSPAIRIDVYIVISVYLKFPPVRCVDSDVASGPEEQRGVGKEGYEHCYPNPDSLTSVLFRFITIANPAPILLQYTVSMKQSGSI
jgi:hypothetical protein